MAILHPQHMKDIAAILDALNGIKYDEKSPDAQMQWGSGLRAHIHPAHVLTDCNEHLGYLEDEDGLWTFNPTTDEKESN